jgi:hypothetical protein
MKAKLIKTSIAVALLAALHDRFHEIIGARREEKKNTNNLPDRAKETS